MREVGREHDVVDPDMVPLLDRDALVLHREIDVLAHVMARQFLERLEAELLLGPPDVALVPKVHVLEPKRDPAEPRLGEEDLQSRIALKDAAQHQLRDADRGRQPEIAQPFEKRPAQPLHDDRVFLRVFHGRLVGARAGAVEEDMHRHRHVEIDRGGPEAVVLRRRIALAVRERAKLDAFEAELFAMLHLGDRVFGVADRHDAETDQTVGRDGAIFLGEPVVIGADDGLVGVVMRDVAPEHGARDHRRKQDLGVEPVLVLLLNALLGRAGTGGVGDLESEGLPGALGAAGAQIEEIGFEERLTLDHLRVAAIRQVHGARRAVTVLFRDPVRPALGRHFEMPVRRHQLVLPGHSNPPDPRLIRERMLSQLLAPLNRHARP